jgi:polysaccharide deacetylase family protein (PEP-CTERM system associated)
MPDRPRSTNPIAMTIPQTQPADQLQGVFSVDLEDWYQGIELPSNTWASYETRTSKGLMPLLDLLDETQTRGTFFTLGFLAEHEPAIIREVARRGHDLASHGYGHDKVYDLGPEAFRQDVRRTKHLLEDLTGQAVTAYRAPYFTITRQSLWAFDILAEAGYTTDASVSPTVTWRYGIESCPDEVFRLTECGMLEFPSSTFELLGKRLNIGGAYLRIFPVELTQSGIKQRLEAQKPVMLYVHPWEYDPGHPRVPLHWKARLTHYSRLTKMLPNTRKLLTKWRFGTLQDYLQQHESAQRISTHPLAILQSAPGTAPTA